MAHKVDFIMSAKTDTQRGHGSGYKIGDTRSTGWKAPR